MNLNAILYTSQTGYTRQYAMMLGEKTGLPVYSLKEGISQLPGGSNVIYLGWIHASHVKGYSRAANRFSVRAVCGVGLCDPGTMTPEVRKATAIPANIPLFTLQGGLDRSRLKGMDKLMISLLAKSLASQSRRSAQDERMLQLLQKDAGYVREENMAEIFDWYNRNSGAVSRES